MRTLPVILTFLIVAAGCQTGDTNQIGQEINFNSNIQKSDSLLMIECEIILKRLQGKKLDTIGEIIYHPKNFDECIVQLDTLINDSLKQWIICLPDKEFGYKVHHSYGMYLRNNWGLWGDTELSKNMYNMGIFHPDDMSAIILHSYQRKLKGEALRLDEQLKYYQDYWRETGVPVDSLLNEINKLK